MALKNFRPLTPTQRFKQTPGFDEITKEKPEKSLIEPVKRTGGRNNNGRLTSRHIGGGHKRKYRVIDFKRKLRDVEATVEAIEYDPNRSARIALIQYPGGEKAYILAPNGLGVGSKIVAGDNVAPELGNALPLKAIPLGTVIHNVEIIPGQGRPGSPERRSTGDFEQPRRGLRACADAFRRDSAHSRKRVRDDRPGRKR